MTNLNFKEHGQGEEVIMIHGYLETSNMWKDMVSGIDGYRFILPDLLGHGKTEKSLEVNTMEDQAKEIIALMDDLNIDKAKFVGHSMGGYITLSIARDYPERVKGLFLFYSKSLPDSEETKEKRDKVAVTAPKNKNLFITNSVKNLFNPNKLDQFSDELADAITMAKETSIEGIVAGAKGMKHRKDTTPVIVEAKYPVFIQLGKYDAAVDVSYKDEIPKKENIHIKITETGHLGHYEAPKASKEFLLEFLKA